MTRYDARATIMIFRMGGMITFLRRRGLGAGSVRGILSFMETPAREALSNGTPPDLSDTDYMVRWGCTARTAGVEYAKMLNTSCAIHSVNDKAAFRELIRDSGVCPPTYSSPDDMSSADLDSGVVIRPKHHAQGRNFHICYGYRESVKTVNALRDSGKEPYITVLIRKSAEYRVFVAQGRAVWVASKTPGNPDQVAWNVAQGGRFDNVRWGAWPIPVVNAAIKAFNLTDLDFGGVDVIVDTTGKPYVLEINSAPSQTSPYRQSCCAALFDYVAREGRKAFQPVESATSWKDLIHPSIRG